MRIHGIDIPEDRIRDFCQRHQVRRLSLFGSLLRDDFGPESDIDVLVEFAGPTPSLFTLGGMLMELREMLERDVDLKTPSFLPDSFRERVLRDARVLYAA